MKLVEKVVLLALSASFCFAQDVQNGRFDADIGTGNWEATGNVQVLEGAGNRAAYLGEPGPGSVTMLRQDFTPALVRPFGAMV
jgi:hypothetical protein